MGREVRRVPAEWQHPTNERGEKVPLHGGSVSARIAEWDEQAARWAEGLCPDWEGGWKPIEDKYKDTSFADWDGERPDPADYMPDWPDAERTHYQMYETTSEGTPISPVFADPDELAHWLADGNASAFGHMTASYEQWRAMINDGSAPSMVVADGVLQSGVGWVAANADLAEMARKDGER